MAVRFLGLLLLTPLCLASWVSGSLGFFHSEDCGLQQIAFLQSPEECYFFLDRKAVDLSLLCEVLESHVGSGCLAQGSSDWEEWRRIHDRYCRVDSSSLGAAPADCTMRADHSEYTHQRGSYTFLPEQSAQAPVLSEFSRRSLSQGVEYHSIFSVTPEKVVFASSGLLLLSCIMLCPCFHAKKKDVSEQPIRGKEPTVADSAISFDGNSASERIPGSPLRVPGSPLRAPGSPLHASGSPLRVPGSPLRVPPSPLRVPPSPSRFSLSPQSSKIGSVHLSVSQIAKATQNFSLSQKIGEGGFGTVYKATLPEGQIVAVKRARKEYFAALRTEFSNEVELLAKIEHRNLVKLLGFVDKGNERIIITEYVPNGTLREHLDGQHGKILDFNQRIEIAIDVAHGLTYLHLYAEKTIIHRDVKSSNILLTESLRAKVADFGFARTGPGDSDQTHISTKVKGTVGYLDPEYLKTYQLTPKSDVFSFGVLLIEILSGRRPVDLRKAPDERLTIKWAFKKCNEGNVKHVMDPLLKEVVDDTVLRKLFSLAFRCSASTRADRPAMKEVSEQLWEIRKEYGRTLRRGESTV